MVCCSLSFSLGLVLFVQGWTVVNRVSNIKDRGLVQSPITKVLLLLAFHLLSAFKCLLDVVVSFAFGVEPEVVAVLVDPLA